MSASNGTLAHSLSEARDQARLARLRLARAQAESEARLLEGFAGPGFAFSPYLDPFRFSWAAGVGTWLPPGLGGRAADRRHGVNRPFIWTETHLEWMRARAAVLEAENDLAKGVLRHLTNYTVKTGYTWEAVATDPTDGASQALAKQVQEVVDEFDEINLAGQWERDQFYWSRVDGESIVRLFAQPDGTTLLRPVESCQLRQPPGTGPEWEGGWRSWPGDILCPQEFAVTYQADRPDDVEYVPASDVAFLPLNVRRTVKRGLSDFYSSGDSLHQVKDLLNTLEVVAEIQARVPWIEQYNGLTRTGLLAAIAQRRALNLPAQPGGDPISGRDISRQQFLKGEIPMVGEGKEYIAQPSAGNVPNHIAVVQASLRALGNRWGMPEFLVSGDASNNNYASIFISGGPWVQSVECEQELYRPHFKAWRWRAVRNAARAGRFRVNGRTYDEYEVEQMVDIHGTPPQVAISNKGEEANVDHQDLEAGVISKAHRRAKLGVDSDKIEADLKAEGTGGDGEQQGPSVADVLALQKAYTAGDVSREAAIANAVLTLGLDAGKAAALFPEKPPKDLTPKEPPEGGGGLPPGGGPPPPGAGPPGMTEGKDASGHEHKGKGEGGGQFAAGGGDDLGAALGASGSDSLTPEHEAKLDSAADKKAGGILSAIASLPGKVIPQRVKDAATKVKDFAVRKLTERYGERAAGLILKAAAISAPVPVPGSQPITIAVSLLVAEAVRAFRGAPKATPEGVEASMTAAELADAAREFLADLEKQLKAELGSDVTEGRLLEGEDIDLGDPAERAELIADIFGGLFGERAMELLAAGNQDEPDEGEDQPVAEGRLLEAWNALDHPRGANGRFIPRGSAEAVSAAREAIGAVLKGGEHTPEQAEQVLQHLSILTVKQLQALHKEHGVKAPGRLRQQLVDGIKARLEAGTKKAAPKADALGVEKPPAAQPKVMKGGTSEAEAHERIMGELRDWRAQNEAKGKPSDGLQKTLGAVYQVRSKPTVAKFGPHQGKEVVKVFYRPLFHGVASREYGSEGIVHAGASSAKEEWVPVERVKQWRQNVKELMGADPSGIDPMDVDDHPQLNSRAVYDKLNQLRGTQPRPAPDHPLAGKPRAEQYKALAAYQGQHLDQGNADPAGLAAAGPPEGVDLAALGKGISDTIRANRDGNPVEIEKLYAQHGRGMSKRDFQRALVALDKAGTLRVRGGNFGVDMLSQRGADPELVTPTRGGLAVHAGLPAGEAATVGVQPAAAPQSVVDTFHRLNQASGGNNYVSIADLHDALGGGDLGRTHAAINDLRRAGVLTGQSLEGRHGADPRLLAHAIRQKSGRSDEDILSHVALRPDWQDALKAHLARRGATEGLSPAVRARYAELRERYGDGASAVLDAARRLLEGLA